MPPTQRSGPQRVVLIGDGALAAQLAAGFGQSPVAIIGETPPSASGATTIRCSFETESDVKTALAEAQRHLSGVDQIVHAWYPPSILQPAEFTALDEQAWAAGCERALEAAWWVARHALERLRPSSGSMVFVVPTIGMSGGAGFAMLAAVAEGLRVLAKGCGRQWGAHGVTANTVAVAPHLLVGDEAGTELTRAVSLSSHALGSAGDPASDLAPLIGLLNAPDAHFVTAATLVADGGLWMGL